MAMQITNTSKGKVIGVGNVTVLPGETREVPAGYETNPVLSMYENLGFARISGDGPAPVKSESEAAAEKAAAEAKALEDAENLRQARLAALNGISEEDLGKMARDLGINPAECKDSADVLKKVRAALKK